MGEEDEETQPPLADLSDHIRSRTPASSKSDPWDRFETPPPSATMWERLEHSSPVGKGSSDGLPAPSKRSPVTPLQSSSPLIVAHAWITVAVLVVALGVYVAAFVQLIPERFWLLSLPLFAISVVGFVPILAWKTGIWDPEALE